MRLVGEKTELWLAYDRLRAAIMDSHREASERIMAELRPRIERAEQRGDKVELERLQRIFVSSMAPYSRAVARELARLPAPAIIIQ